MKIELNYYEITIYGLLIINLMNWLDGVLTYIGLYIIPKGIFYETNIDALNLFNSIGFWNFFIYKLCYILFLGIIFIYFVNKHFLVNIKKSIIFNNLMYVWFILIFINLLRVTFSNTLYLIKYYL